MSERVIKFRGMSINGGWHYGLLSNPLSNKTLSSRVVPGNWYICNSVGMPFAYEIRPETIGQFTGLKDAKGRDIYEGDIIEGARNPNLRHVITWVEGEAGFGCYSPPLQYFQTPSAGLRQTWITEFDKTVIGNIYEHPELLSASSEAKACDCCNGWILGDDYDRPCPKCRPSPPTQSTEGLEAARAIQEARCFYWDMHRDDDPNSIDLIYRAMVAFAAEQVSATLDKFIAEVEAEHEINDEMSVFATMRSVVERFRK